MIEGKIPGILNLEKSDFESDSVDLISGKCDEYDHDFVMKNSLGFGGINVSVIYSKLG